MSNKNQQPITAETIQEKIKPEKVIAYIDPDLHKSAKIFSAALALKIQDFVALAIEEKIKRLKEEIAEGKLKILDIMEK